MIPTSKNNNNSFLYSSLLNNKEKDKKKKSNSNVVEPEPIKPLMTIDLNNEKPKSNLDNLDYENVKNIFINNTNKNTTKRIFSDINKKSKGQCTAGAMNCSQDFISKNTGLKGLRSIIANSNTSFDKYKVPSSDIRRSGDYKENSSLDAWEAHSYLRGEGLGNTLFEKSEEDVYDKRSYFPQNFDFKSVPLGAIIGQGNSKGVYTDPKDGDRNRHLLIVSAFDDKDDMPMVYDSGRLVRIDELEKGVFGTFFENKVTNITVPNEYEGLTAQAIKERVNNKLQIKEDYKFSYNSDKKYIQAIEKGVNKSIIKASKNYNIPVPTLEKLAKYLPGISYQETKLNSNEKEKDRSLISRQNLHSVADSAIGNYVAKPFAKLTEFALSLPKKVIENYQEKEDAIPDYKLEIKIQKELENLFPDATKEELKKYRDKAFNDAKKYYKEFSPSLNLDPSVGPFANKEVDEFSEKALSIKKSHLYGATVSNEVELLKGSQVALSHLANSYKELKKAHKDLNLSEEDLINLAIINYNNNSKAYDKDFVKYYIKEKSLTDDYLSKVKSYTY